MFLFDSTFNSADMLVIVGIAVVAVLAWRFFRARTTPPYDMRVGDTLFDFKLADDLAVERAHRGAALLRQATAYRRMLERTEHEAA